jgi:8-oxo-dGTP pyrophosphatase MutT (NUDIX family)
MSERKYEYPVPAVRLLVVDDQDRVLLLKRDNTAYEQGLWCLPGGKVDYGDTAEETAVAELKEETGLSCSGLRFLFYLDSAPIGPGKMQCINLYFECEALGQVTLSRESSDYAWLDARNLDGYSIAFGNDVALRRYWSSEDGAVKQPSFG